MTRAYRARGVLVTMGMVVAGASMSGMGLAAYATGGEIGGIVQREAPPTALGANRAALAADRFGDGHADLITASYASGPYECEGCGPTLADRKARAAAARYEAALAADDARFAELMSAPPEPQQGDTIVLRDDDKRAEPTEGGGQIMLASLNAGD